MTFPDLPFIHPLIGSDDTWAGYLVEFPPGKANAESLTALCEHPLLDEFDHRHPWLLPAWPGISAHCALGGRAICTFPAYLDPDGAEALQALESELRKAHRRVGLTLSANGPAAMNDRWDFLVLDSSHARTLTSAALHDLSRRSTVLARGVLSHAERAWLTANACQLTTGEYLLTRNADCKKADMTRVKLLELLALVTADADTPALDAIFRQEAKLAYSLLRLVNSAAMAPRSPIHSFSQAINLLGRRHLQRWLQLLVFADPNNGHQANPLLLKAAARGRLMELLAQRVPGLTGADSEGDAAFMVGTFSLLTILLNMPTKEILQQLPLTETVRLALAEQKGKLGQLLSFIEAAEARNLRRAAEKAHEIELDGERFLEAQLAAFHWTSRIHVPH